MQKRKKFERPQGEQRYRKLFIIAAEGTKTEPQYFALFKDRRVIRLHCLGGSGSSPSGILKRMEYYLKKDMLQESDEAWLVVDKNHWTEEQLGQLHEWSQKKDNYGFALSNPKFEYWLLLHFEDGDGIASSRECTVRLKRCFPSYDRKGIDIRKITNEMIDDAVRRAKVRDNPPCDDWPRDIWGTTVYRLVENIRKVKDIQ